MKGQLRSSMHGACTNALRYQKATPAIALKLIVKEPNFRGEPNGKLIADSGIEANRLWIMANGPIVRKRTRRTLS